MEVSLYQLLSLIIRKGVSHFQHELCSPYKPMLSAAPVKIEISPYIRGVMKWCHFVLLLLNQCKLYTIMSCEEVACCTFLQVICFSGEILKRKPPPRCFNLFFVQRLIVTKNFSLLYEREDSRRKKNNLFVLSIVIFIPGFFFFLCTVEIWVSKFFHCNCAHRLQGA